MKVACHDGSGRLINDTDRSEPGNEGSIACRLLLRCREVCRDGDDSVLHCPTASLLRNPLHLYQDLCRDGLGCDIFTRIEGPYLATPILGLDNLKWQTAHHVLILHDLRVLPTNPSLHIVVELGSVRCCHSDDVAAIVSWCHPGRRDGPAGLIAKHFDNLRLRVK